MNAMKYLVERKSDGKLFGYDRLDLLLCNVAEEPENIGRFYEQEDGITLCYKPSDLTRMQIRNLFIEKENLENEMRAELASHQKRQNELAAQMKEINLKLRTLKPD